MTFKALCEQRITRFIGDTFNDLRFYNNIVSGLMKDSLFDCHRCHWCLWCHWCHWFDDWAISHQFCWHSLFARPVGYESATIGVNQAFRRRWELRSPDEFRTEFLSQINIMFIFIDFIQMEIDFYIRVKEFVYRI